MPLLGEINDAGTHHVLFYSEDRYLAQSLVDAFEKPLRAGDAVIIVATAQHRAAVVDLFRSRGLDPSLAADQGRFFLLDAAQLLAATSAQGVVNPDRFERIVGDLVTQARAAVRPPAGQVLIFGEMVSLLCDRNQQAEALRLEQLWNTLASRLPFTLHCAYPIRNFSRAEHAECLRLICNEHSSVTPTEDYMHLANEDERLRQITYMQQRLQELACERTELQQTKAQVASVTSRNTELMEEVRRRERAEEGLRELSGRLLTLRDEERHRIAQELHESTAQLLAALGINLRLVESERDALTPRTVQYLDRSSELVQELIEQIRALSYLLHPPTLDEMGLRSALEWYVRRFSQRSKIDVSLDMPTSFGRLPRPVEIAVFRIIQESLSNVDRHSGSTTAGVRVSLTDDDVIIEVRDAGKGISAQDNQSIGESPGVGINAMRERVRQLGGRLLIHSRPGNTTVRARLPRNEPNSNRQGSELVA